jgi:hypothetical protein
MAQPMDEVVGQCFEQLTRQGAERLLGGR